MSDKMCKVVYLLNEEGRKASLLNGGNGKRVQEIETPITKELLEIGNVDNDGNVLVEFGGTNLIKSPSKIKISTKINERRTFSLNKPEIESVRDVIEFDKPKTVEELLAFEKNRVLEYNKSLKLNEEKIKPLLEEYQIKKEEEKKKEEERIEQQRIEIEERAKIQREKEKQREIEREEDVNWIRTNGSDYLKKCLDLGYNCKRKYIEERVSKEFPGYQLDFDDTADWKDRVSPSVTALDEVSIWLDKGFNAEIIWLTKPIEEEEWDYDFECCEAIKIVFKDYTLIKVM